MIIYLLTLSISGCFFLIWMEIIYYRDIYSIYQFYDNVSNTKNIGFSIIYIITFIKDLIQDSVKYILIAIIISVPSIIGYIWAILKPALWKSYVMLIIGIAYCWIAGNPIEEIKKFLIHDTHNIVLITIFIFGHLYIITSVIQIIYWKFYDDNYFYDVVKEKREMKWAKINHLVSNEIEYMKSRSSNFKIFYEELEKKGETIMFNIICHNEAGELDNFEGNINGVINNVYEFWDSVKYDLTKIKIREIESSIV